MAVQHTWNDFITTQLEATGAVVDAIILGKQDGVTWANTKGFSAQTYKATISNEDGTEAEVEVKEHDNLVQFAKTLEKPAAGIRINGFKFMPVRTFPKGQLDDNMPTVYLKKPKGGACLVITKQSIIIGTFDEEKGQNAANLNSAVEALGRYLMSTGF